MASPSKTDKAEAAGGSHQLFLGTFIHSKSLAELEYLHDTAVCVDAAGKIVAVEPQCDLKKAEEVVFPRLGWSAGSVTVHKCKDGQFYFPGFIGQFLFFFSFFYVLRGSEGVQRGGEVVRRRRRTDGQAG